MIIDKKCKEVILNSLIKYHDTNNKEIESIKNNDFKLVNNDLVIGVNKVYHDFFYPVK